MFSLSIRTCLDVASISNDITNSIPETVAKPAISKRGGWEIQIAASDPDAADQNLLAMAKALALGKYHETSPYTQRITSRSVTLYRARFIGFDNRPAVMAIKSVSVIGGEISPRQSLNRD